MERRSYTMSSSTLARDASRVLPAFTDARAQVVS
jgi:hypothetical protein